MAKSTRKRTANKPEKPGKPYEGFPLFDHNSGRWAKKIGGKLHYFGRWGNKQGDAIVWVDDVKASANAALELYNEQRADLEAGRTPRPKVEDGMTVKELADRFLTAKKHLLDNGELSPRTFRDYFAICQDVADTWGKSRRVDDLLPADFDDLRNSFAKTHGPYRLGKDVRVTRMLFKFAYEAGHIDRPMRLGPNFKEPSKKAKRKARRANGKKDFDADELRRIIDAAPMPLRAMILLGINCGFGQTDVANLPRSAVDFERGWIDYPRPKTEIERRCPLWPETIAALQDADKKRGEPKDPADADCVFITKYGNRWVRMGEHDRPEKRAVLDAITQAFSDLLKRLDINGRRGFYGLRHTFETVGGESRDQVAVDLVMGHSDQSMAANYRHRVSDERLQDVVECVRTWLWPKDDDSDAGE